MGGWLDTMLGAIGAKPMPKAQAVMGNLVAAAKAQAKQPPQPQDPPLVICDSVTVNATHCRPAVGPKNNATTIVIKSNEPAAYVPREVVNGDTATTVHYVDSALRTAGFQRNGSSEWRGDIGYYRVPISNVEVTIDDAQAGQPVQPDQAPGVDVPNQPGSCVGYSDPSEMPDCVELPNEQ